MSTPDCQTCQRPMTAADLQIACRWYGLPLSPALVADCRKYLPIEPDASRVWFAGAWCEGRGD